MQHPRKRAGRLALGLALALAAGIAAACSASGGGVPSGAQPAASASVQPAAAESATAFPAVVSATAVRTSPGMSATPAPTSSAGAPAVRIITLADDGTTLRLGIGMTFLLRLGSDFDWTVRVADPTIVAREVNVLVVRGAQGIYRALKPGTTALTAQGDPPCRKAQPPCGAPSRLFHITIAVQ